MNHNLKKKTLLITGGLGDFGKAITKKFSQYGCDVIITTTKKERASKIKKKGILYLDFNDPVSIKEFEHKIKHIKKIDYLINNAGINRIDPIYNIKKKNLKEITNVNLIGPTWLTSLVSKKMKINRFGRIINISSIFGVVGKEKRSIYSITKFGLNGLTTSSALDLAKYNILINTISPGVFDTKLTRRVLKKKGIKNIKLSIPLNKLGKPESIARLCIFLCSKENDYITGQNIIIDGGYTCG